MRVLVDEHKSKGAARFRLLSGRNCTLQCGAINRMPGCYIRGGSTKVPEEMTGNRGWDTYQKSVFDIFGSCSYQKKMKP